MSMKGISAERVSALVEIYTFFGFYVVDQGETGVLLTLGNFNGRLFPGLHWLVPIFQKAIKTSGRVQTIDLPEQQIVLKGNIEARISGNMNFRVKNPERAILDVDNYAYSIQQLALTTIVSVLGNKTIEELRTHKTEIADEIEVVVFKAAEKWGIGDVDIRLTDARMDDAMSRAMMRETEAQKEASAVYIKAAADRKSAELYASAATILASAPGALTLRVLQTLTDLSKEKSTIVMPIPIEFLSVFKSDNVPVRNPSPVKPYPVAELIKENSDVFIECPSCGNKYCVSEVIGKPELDADLKTPGQQGRCKNCGTMFTIGT